MSDIITVLNQLEEFDFMNGASEEDIVKAETALGLKFAPDYRRYLSEYGRASGDGHELTGIVKSPRLNVVDVTMRMRKKFKNIPADAYVLEELGIDGIVIFQALNGTVYEATPESPFNKAADSFSEYLEG